jgi:diaminopimelate epimerase
MPGGKLAIEIGKDFDVLMTGPVTRVGEGTVDGEIFSGGAIS